MIIPVELLSSGDEVVVATEGRGKGRTSGAIARASAAQVWRVEHGKVLAWTAYQAKAEALEAVVLRE